MKSKMLEGGKLKRSVMRSPATILMFVLFFIYGASILFVVFQGLATSVIHSRYYGKIIIPTASEHFYFQNYADAFSKLAVSIGNNRKVNIIGMTVNSLWYAVGSSFFSILFSSITAYILSKYRFPGRNALYIYAVVTMMLPIMGSAASSVVFYRDLGILDTNFMILMFTSSFGDNFIMLYATFKGISWEYAEAAFIDGANHFKVWYQVMIPQAISPMFALFMVGFIARWSDSETALLYMQTHPTIASGLMELSHRESANMPLLFSGFMMSMIPVLALYIAFQNVIMDIQIGGGLKG